MVLDDRSRYHDLTLFGICVFIKDDVTELYGVVESDNEEIKHDQGLENYLVGTNPNVSPQSMARTKQTARKSDKKGVIPVTTAGTIPVQNPPLTSPGGLSLAILPARGPTRFLESDSELEQAANLYSVDMDLGSPARSTRSKSPGNTSGSPARGRPRGRSPARGSPARSTQGKSPARDSPARGRGNRGRGGSSRGRGVIPAGDPTPGTSRGGIGGSLKPGQAGYVKRGGAARSSPARFNLPSFSSPDDDDDDEEEEMEVDFPNLSSQPQQAPKRKIAAKDINLIRAPKRGKGGFTEIARWNATARQGTFNETKRGWMRKPQRNSQNRGIRRARVGLRAIREIRFYQGSTCFLIPMRAFQRAVRQIALDVALTGKEYRWQARALFALQQSTEAFLVAYLADANLLAIHAHRTTIMDKDMHLVRRMRGRRAIGFEFGDDCGV